MLVCNIIFYFVIHVMSI